MRGDKSFIEDENARVVRVPMDEEQLSETKLAMDHLGLHQ